MTVNEAVEPAMGQSSLLSVNDYINQITQSCRSSCNWTDFLYTLTFGFLPTAWDVYTDISLGVKLEKEEDVHTAGLCWMFVCFPLVFLVIENVTTRIHSAWTQVILLILLALFFTASCAYLVNWHPLVFYYPAVCLSLLLLGGKLLAVFVHTPEMKQFSTHLSHLECCYEASCQLLLILTIWLTGGEMHLASMVSSAVTIGKVSAENYLMAEPENLLANKSFIDRIKLTLRFMPVFGLTAFFRCGAGVVNVLNYVSFNAFSPAFVIFLLYCSIIAYCFCFILLCCLLRLVMDDLAQLTMVELCYSLVSIDHIV